MSARFATTQWSQVLAARDPTGTESQEALASLCEAYWYPLYAYVRSQGHDPEESRDLTQAYFAYLLEKNILEDVDPSAGRFRSFLLATLKHYVAKEHRKQSTLKRGGGTQTISLDTEDAETRYGLEPAERSTPEQVYENRWAMTVLERAMQRLGNEWSERRKQFEHLKPHLTGQEPRIPYREVAAELEMTEVAVRGAVHRLPPSISWSSREPIGIRGKALFMGRAGRYDSLWLLDLRIDKTFDLGRAHFGWNG